MVRVPLMFSNPVQGRDVFTGGALWSPHKLTPASVTVHTIALQAPLSMGFSRQECWSGLPFPSPGALPDPGIEPTSPPSPALADGFFTTVPPRKPVPSSKIGDTESALLVAVL